MANFQRSKINPKGFYPSQIPFFIILISIAVIMALPVLYVLMAAFKPMEELFKFPPAIFPKNPTFSNFRALMDAMSLTTVPVSRYIFNTVLVTVAVMLFSLIFGIFAGYVLSKSSIKGKKLLFDINTMALMFVPVAVTIPKFLILTKLGLYNSFFSNILPLVAVPVGLFLLKQFIDQIPDALIESARMDGAGELRIIWSIMIPLLKPSIATVAMLCFQTAWGSTEASILYIDEESRKVFAYFMVTFSTSNMGIAGTGINAASALIMFLPNLVMFILLQRNVLATMAHSGIK